MININKEINSILEKKELEYEEMHRITKKLWAASMRLLLGKDIDIVFPKVPPPEIVIHGRESIDRCPSFKKKGVDLIISRIKNKGALDTTTKEIFLFCTSQNGEVSKRTYDGENMEREILATKEELELLLSEVNGELYRRNNPDYPDPLRRVYKLFPSATTSSPDCR